MNLVKAHLTPNPWSRPQKPLKPARAIVLHWTAYPMGTAQGVHDWFEGRKDQGKQYKGMEYGSAHYCVDLDGSIWELIPPDEMAYHVGADKYEPDAIAKTSKYPNDCTIGIELCVTNWAGDYTPETVESARRLVEFLGNSSRTIEWVMYHTNFPLGGWDCPRQSIYGNIQIFPSPDFDPLPIEKVTKKYVTVKSETMTPSGQILAPGVVCEINAMDFGINQILVGCPAKKAQTWTAAANVEPIQ